MIGYIGANPKITNLVLENASEEYFYEFGRYTKKLMFQVRDFKDIRFALNEGETSTNYFSLISGSPYWEDHIIGPIKFYFKAETDNNVVLEILEWQLKD